MKILGYFLLSTILIFSCAPYQEPIFRLEPLKPSTILVTASILTRSETLDKFKIDFYEVELAPVVINIHNGTPDPITISYQDMGIKYKETKSEFKPTSGEAISNLLKKHYGSSGNPGIFEEALGSAIYGGIWGAIAAAWVNDIFGGHYVSVSGTALNTAKWYGITTLVLETLTYDPSSPESSPYPKKYGNLGEGSFLIEGNSNAEIIIFTIDRIEALKRDLTLKTLGVELKKGGIPVYRDFINFTGDLD